MSLNQSTGNMFDWVTHTWNTVKGECPHGCHYCYMKKWGAQKPIRFDESELKTDLGTGNTIFVGSSCDLFAESIPNEWIIKTTKHCKQFSNTYLFQTKNPKRMASLSNYLPNDCILGTTIESDIFHDEMGHAPPISDRAAWITGLHIEGFKTTITIEPVMKFNLHDIVNTIKCCNPDWVSIGANTNAKINLDEPSKDDIISLIKQISEFTKVNAKSNLERLLK